MTYWSVCKISIIYIMALLTFWCGSGSGSSDPCLWLMDPDSDPVPGSGSCYFRHWASRCQQKTNFKKVFLLVTFEGTFTSFFKDKKSRRSHKTLGIEAYFLHFLLAYWRNRIQSRIRIHTWLVDPDPGGPKACGSGSGCGCGSGTLLILPPNFRRIWPTKYWKELAIN